MSSEDRIARRWRFPELAADVMLLIVPIGIALAGVGAGLLAPLNSESAGFALGLALAPPAALVTALLLHHGHLGASALANVAFSAVLTLLLGGIAYVAVLSTGFDRSAGFDPLMIAALALEGVVAAWLVARAIADFSRRGIHRPLDITRIVIGIGLAMGAIVLWTRPDGGGAFTLVAPLALAGALTGRFYDLFTRMRAHRTSSHHGTPRIAA